MTGEIQTPIPVRCSIAGVQNAVHPELDFTPGEGATSQTIIAQPCNCCHRHLPSEYQYTVYIREDPSNGHQVVECGPTQIVEALPIQQSDTALHPQPASQE